MSQRLPRFVLTLAFMLISIACGDHSPVAPTAMATPTAPASPESQPATGELIKGHVYDTANRPLLFATVEVLDGPSAGKSARTDGLGEFALTGVFDETTRFRATKEGHVTGTGTLDPFCDRCNPHRWMTFFLESLVPPVSIAGDYTLTFVANATCTGLPDGLRTRTYQATIAPASYRPDTAFELRVRGATFLEGYQTLAVHIAGNYLTFWLGDLHGTPGVAETLAPATYLGFGGWGEATVDAPAVSTISTSFDGFIDYCERKSAMATGSRYSCTPDEAVANARCESNRHQLILTRR